MTVGINVLTLEAIEISPRKGENVKSFQEQKSLKPKLLFDTDL